MKLKIDKAFGYFFFLQKSLRTKKKMLQVTHVASHAEWFSVVLSLCPLPSLLCSMMVKVIGEDSIELEKDMQD